jgi:gamma-glutamyltranspeptidase/glutathione hydrolase
MDRMSGWSTESVHGPDGVVCSVDRQASACGVAVLQAGGNAVDAAVATSAALAVTTPHMCGMGGDLFALVHGPVTGEPEPAVLNSSGRAGSGADADRLRAEGHSSMPFRGDVRSAPVPGCVDGWTALHDRFGALPLADVLAPAIALATEGSALSPLLAFTLSMLEAVEGCEELTGADPDAAEIRRPGVARMLRAVAAEGRDGFYRGEFGERLLAVGKGEYTPDDLATSQAEWVPGLALDVWGHRVWTVPPNSQGYLSLAGAGIAERAGLPADPAAGLWAHLTVESARMAGYDRPEVLHDRADGAALLRADRLDERAARIDPDRAADVASLAAGGGTIYMCTADGAGNAVSLNQSNASGFGCHVAVPGTGVLLHNRGIGFSLEPGHPAEYAPGRRPPHTLSPALVTTPDGRLRTVLGSMGGDSQPQIVLQLLARLLHAGEDPGTIIGAPRWVLGRDGGSGFDIWADGTGTHVRIETHAPAPWEDGLARRGHDVRRADSDVAGFGHAHLIDMTPEGPVGASDPRAIVGAAVPA